MISAQIYVESHLSNTATKFYGELTQQMIKMGDSPGSDNGTGFFQTLASLKIREFYEKLSGVEVEVEALMVTTTPLALAISVHIRYLIHPINIYNAIRTHRARPSRRRRRGH